ncbi:alpha/beta fold hydrolase [Actinorugispora endophytica]|uniref:Pimeloyl-ACP methyl ester carboxylesterase n=1 Tax=Actinorugispora endophytica TaxID=1605990 RepID=A0A4R6UGJ3_9ACTN|nr:alpha/beta hydrolase [Actinorugispora endophytica]TDQ45422.1 pimeloyl-ACP methyl ester carboxylesterase [Actinorugispora endophytica]
MDINHKGDVTVRLLDRRRGRIAYDLYGAGNTGPLVVCVPGMGSVRGSFRFLAPALAEQGYRVAAMDLRGHGDSDVSFDEYGDEAAGSDAIALIGELGDGPAVLIGNSMGAAAAVWASVERPDLVSALVLTGPFLRDAPSGPARRLLMRLMFLRPWGPALIKAYMGKLYPGPAPEGHSEHVAAVAAALRPRDRYRAVIRTFGSSHAAVETRLPEVAVPSLVVMGEADPDWPDPAAEADWIRGRIGADVLMVPGSGHYPHEQRPDLVNRAVLEFARGAVRG